MGTILLFPEAQQMAEHLAAQSQALLVWLGVDKTQAVVSHQPPLPICSSIQSSAFPHDSAHGIPGGSSCRELALQSTTRFSHNRLSLVSVIQKYTLGASPPHPCLATAPPFMKGQSKVAQGTKEPLKTQDEHWSEGGSGRAGGK